MEVLFKTIHGSRLYGLSHPKSDWDFYTVVDRQKTNKKKYATHTIIDGQDSMVVDFGTWINMCQHGTPQALEAMFSQHPIYDDIADFRRNFKVGTTVIETYLRTMKTFVLTQEYKSKRHSLRLALNAADIARYGRFNPSLSPNEKDFISDYAHKDIDCVYAMAMNIALDRYPPGLIR